MLQIDSKRIHNLLPYSEFVPFMEEAYTKEYTVPSRMFNQFGNGVGEDSSTLLQMAAWQDGEYVGVKNVTLSPYNSQFDKPTLQGVYLLFNAQNGSPLAVFDASAITARRTAAKSAVASSFLAPDNPETLLMVGTGTLSAELIKAHCTVHPIKDIIIWEHTPGKGEKVIERLPQMEQNFSITDDLSQAVPKADLISVATLSVNPLIEGKWLQPGQYLDMVGAYRTDMREADDEALERSSLYVDHDEAFEETGDLVIPLENGVIAKEDAEATLFDLCKGDFEYQQNEDEIIFFKSTGHALEDLSAALFVYNQIDKD